MQRTDQPRHVSAHRFARLRASAEAKPRIALMGEFSSGKSSLLNLLLGEEFLPTKVTATDLPPVWFSQGAPRAWCVGRDGRRHAMTFGDFAAVPKAARYVRVFAPAALLERCDIIDTPGISDPNLSEDTWRFAVGQANFMLWCTSATQAWRETERSTWASLPERLRANSVMVVTRADKLGAADREKVQRRLTRETFGLFGSLVLLSTPEAARGQKLLATSGQDDVWRASGGADLDARIEAGLESVRAARLDLLERYVSADTAKPADPVPEDLDLAPALDLVRPRRIEMPGSSRVGRPAADPLEDMRTDWSFLRPAEAPPEPSPVFRLPDPPRSAPPATWIEDDAEDQPLLLNHTWTAPSPTREDPILPEDTLAPVDLSGLGQPEPAPFDLSTFRQPESEPEPFDLSALGQPEPEPYDLSAFRNPEPEPESYDLSAFRQPKPEPELESFDLSAFDLNPPDTLPPAPPVPEDAGSPVALDALLATIAAPEPAPAEALPRAVRLWRDIVARSSEIPSNSPLIAMIDQLLCELSREDELSDTAGPTVETVLGQTQAA